MRTVTRGRTLLAYGRAVNAFPAAVARFYSGAPKKNLLGTSVSDDEGTDLKDDFWKNKKVVLFGVPGAFTPVCSNKHVPSFLENLDKLRAKGVDAVACVSVNDRFVLKGWRATLGSTEGLTLLADWNGEFSKHLGMDIDLSAAGLGPRCKRFSMIVDNGNVVQENVELSPGDFEVTSAEAILAQLPDTEPKSE